jgi:starch phosphorylase
MRTRVAYFCMEYGLRSDLTLYSGGLGVLAGDTLKSAADLRLPMVGVGLFWSHGYARQAIAPDGTPTDSWPPTPRESLVRLKHIIQVPLSNSIARCEVFRCTAYPNLQLYLLSPTGKSAALTQRLYDGDEQTRLAQELLLGVGGLRLLERLRVNYDLIHMNEGHAIFAALELFRRARASGLSFDEALAQTRRRVVFTTHTPVAAGNETHSLAALRRAGAHLGLSRDDLKKLGGEPFSMTEAALRLSCRANAVAELHGETARRMWRHVEGAAPIVSITNGVHVGTWQDPRIRQAMAIGAQSVALVHEELKRELLALIQARTGTRFRPDRLLVGFARRAASYKRGDLIFGDPARLERLLHDRRLQLVFSGKAHPADAEGRAMVTRIVAAARRWPEHVVFLPDYDLDLGAALTRGCDVWLNNPMPPMEASGTSGMKAAMNGVLNLSILDGWWPEGCRHGETGWQVGGDPTMTHSDETDRAHLYDVLEREVMPRYYHERAAWIRMMEQSIHMATVRFSTDRMLDRYQHVLYDNVVIGDDRDGLSQQRARAHRR